MHLLKKEFVLLIVSIATLASVSTIPAFASYAQVYITNSNSTKDCLSVSPCFSPYQITVPVGGTITWTNLDNKTHTVTTGTTNDGPVGTFDSGMIESGKSFTQFFGTIGKYRYYDKTNPLATGMIIVDSGKASHAELAWVNGSLNVSDQSGNTTSPVSGAPITITKDVNNSGGTDATSILFRLKITNSTNFLVYDNFINANIGAQQTVPISFKWLPTKPGNYQLFFDANPSNTIGDTNENNDISFDSLTIFNASNSKINPPTVQIGDNTPSNGVTSAPEFGPLAPIVLGASITSIIIFSSKRAFHS